MDFECLYDCPVSPVIIGLLFVGSALGFAAALRSRRSLLITIPVLLLAIGYVGYMEGWPNEERNLVVLGIPLLGAIRRGRSRSEDGGAPA